MTSAANSDLAPEIARLINVQILQTLRVLEPDALGAVLRQLDDIAEQVDALRALVSAGDRAEMRANVEVQRQLRALIAEMQDDPVLLAKLTALDDALGSLVAPQAPGTTPAP